MENVDLGNVDVGNTGNESMTPINDSLNTDTNTNGIPGSLPGESREETKARLYRVKIDGEEMDVDEEELIKGYQKHRGAEKRIEEASLTKKQAAEVLRLFQENPRKMFEHFGIDPRDFAGRVFQEELEEASLTEEQKELRKYKKFYEERAEQERLTKAEAEAEERQRTLAAEVETLQNQIIDAMEEFNIPRDSNTALQRMVAYMKEADRAGYTLSPRDVAPIVKKDLVAEFRALAGSSQTEQLEELFGSDFIKKVSKASVASNPTKIKTVPKEVNVDIGRAGDKKRPLSPREFFRK